MNGLAVLMLANAAVAAPTQGSLWEPRDYLALVTAGTTIVALIVSYLINVRTLRVSQKNTESGIWQKANEVEMRAIEAQLDGFFGPFMQMSGINKLLSHDLRARQPDTDTFLLLEKLFDRTWLTDLSKGDQAMVAEIAANAKFLREFIASNAKMVDLAILPYLSRLSAHYRILELAFAGALGDDPKPFVNRYVFPIQSDSVLALEVERLQKRLAELRAAPGKAAAPTPPLEIPSKLALKEWVNPTRTDRPELTMPIA